MVTGHQELIADMVAEIARTGPMTFARFMELALYHPCFGYYVRPVDHPQSERIGWSGDFYTSSDVHPFLALALAKQAKQIDELLGHPTPFTVVEMGPGKGLLARDFLAASRYYGDSFCARLRYVLIERSPTMRMLQQEALAPYMDRIGLVSWLGSLDELAPDSVEGLFLSNELVDAFPVHRVMMVEGRLRELYVRWNGAGFEEFDGPLSTPLLTEHFRRLGLTLEEGCRAEINLQAARWMEQVARVVARGVVLTIDYGHSAQDLYGPSRPQGTLLCYYHQTASDDPYTRVGEQDMTAHVDFTSLATVGEASGLVLTGFTNQMSFLIAMGIEEILESLNPDSPEFADAVHLLRPDGMGRTFKMLVQHKGMARPELDGLKFQPFFGSALAVAGTASPVAPQWSPESF
ncbi:MAG TPA: SAM-dependent methyltransferase [Nitrospiraceae bacterium]|nr:SAM-dependent methyltransferase [Nitrospiraceae bacterium]